MQVYVELALCENFCMDFALLYCAKLVTKNHCRILRIALSSAVGACFAVLFPLLNAGTVLSVALKVSSGLIICLLAGKFNIKGKRITGYLKFAGAFLGFTAVLGGALIGIFSLAGLDYESGSVFLISSVPVGIPLFGVILCVIGAKRLKARLVKIKKNSVICRIYAGQCEIELGAFYDSGNKVYIKGQPVSVIPESAAKKLCAIEGIKAEVNIHTVAGNRKMKVFTADRMEISDGEIIREFKDVKIGVGPHNLNRAVLHADLCGS